MKIIHLVLAASALVLVFFSTGSQSLADRPNILFVISDDQSYPHASAYGCRGIRTPGFDRVAKEGVLFRTCISGSPGCSPSRATVLTGRYHWMLEHAGTHASKFDKKYATFPDLLEKAGYWVGYTGKGWGPGFANDASGKPRKITGQAWQKQKAKPPARAISNNDYAGNFAEFLAAAKLGKGSPWAFWYGATEPHRGYEAGVGRRMSKKLSDIDRVPKYWPDNDVIRNDMLDYSIEVEHYDTHLSRILAHLEKAGQLDNTLIVATSDHGMPFPRCKGQAYDYSNHIPLAIRWPKGIKGSNRRVEDFVNFTDLAPTFRHPFTDHP